MEFFKVRQAVAVQIPGYSVKHDLLIQGGKIALKVLLIVRKIRLYSNPKNAIPLGAGSLLNVAIGRKPTVQQIARFVFLTISSLRVAEDISEIFSIGHKIYRMLSGKEYILIKKDPAFRSKNWKVLGPAASAALSDALHRGKERLRLTFHLIAELFKRLLLLTFHLADVYAAFTENSVSEVVVHTSDLFRHLTSDEYVLGRELRNLERTSDSILARFNSSFTTKVLLTGLALPGKIKRALPDPRDIGKEFKSIFWEHKLIFMALREKANGVRREDREYDFSLGGKSVRENRVIRTEFRAIQT